MDVLQVVVAAVTAVAAFGGALVGVLITRATAKRQQSREMLRWAADRAVSSDPAQQRLGAAELEALLDHGDLDEAARAAVRAALEVRLDPIVKRIEPASQIEVHDPDDRQAPRPPPSGEPP